jgi:hypothetical protein
MKPLSKFRGGGELRFQCIETYMRTWDKFEDRWCNSLKKLGGIVWRHFIKAISFFLSLMT